MNNKKINNIDEYIKKSTNLIKSGFFTYRGQCNSSWSLEPGIIRKIKKTYTGIEQSGLLFSLSVNQTIELVKKARITIILQMMYVIKIFLLFFSTMVPQRRCLISQMIH